MIAWWKRHVAWRLRPASARDTSSSRATKLQARKPERASSMETPSAPPRPRPVVAPGAGCAKCAKPREDETFKMCRRCRSMASHNATRRRRVHQRKGACSKCGGPRDGDNLVCSGCRAYARQKYAERAASRAKMAPPQ